MTPESILSIGLIAGRGTGGGGVAPAPSCLELDAVGEDWASFTVIPPAGDPDYSSSRVLYTEVEGCGYSEAGPEDGSDNITVTGLVQGAIYIFVPVALGLEGARSNPGNVIIATVPVNLVDMAALGLNSCGLADVWALLQQKVNMRELDTSLQTVDSHVATLAAHREQLIDRLYRLEAEIAAIRGKL
jgi:hypothetical protein